MDLKCAISAALAAGVFAATPVLAADPSSSSDSERADKAFTRLDTNKDGNIDQNEAKARPRLEKNFSQYDKDHDGKLGKDEFAAALSALRTARGAQAGGAGSTADASRYFDSLDKNNDGNLDPAEVAAIPGLQKNFSQYDLDHNGKLGKDEFAAALSAQRSAAGGASAAAGATSSAASFDSLDKNKDGNIDASEAAAAPWLQQGFSQYDLDHNGKLGKDEFATAQKSQPK